MVLSQFCNLFCLSGVLLMNFSNVFGALYFDGSREYAVVDNYNLVNSIGSGSFSIQSWFKISADDNVDTFASILSTRSCSCYSGFLYGFTTYGSRQDPWMQYKYNRFPNGGDFRDNEWHHFLAIHDTTANTLKFYMDGSLHYQVTVDGYSLSINHALWIGLDDGSEYNTQFAGYLDDIAVWNRVLTSNEISVLSQYPIYAFGELKNDANLLHYYPFERILNSQTIEDVKSGYNGYLGNSASTTTYDPVFSYEHAEFSCYTPNMRRAWTPWFDRDNPSGTGDYETWNAIAAQYGYSTTDVYGVDYYMEDWECVSVNGEIDFDDYDFGDVSEVYCNRNGFRCVNSNTQTCPDFKVRFLLCPIYIDNIPSF